MSHGDYMAQVPAGFRLVGHTAACPNVAIADETRGFYGVQFHPEVNHTQHGTDMIRNFLYRVCGAAGDWTMEGYKNRAIVQIREKVGGGKPIPIDVRFISATRQNLAEMVERGEFREDLYYRLNVVNIETLPLREHPTDILLYANHVLNALNAKYKTGHLLSDRVKYLLMCYKWPGNVRELINVITSAYATCDSYVIEEMDLPGRLVSGTAGNSVSQMKLSEMMNLHEAAIIRDALRRNNQNCKKTAEELGIDRSLLYRKMRKAGIAIHREIK